MTGKSVLAIGVVAVVLAFCFVGVFEGRQLGNPNTGIGSRITWYCYDKGEPRPHVEDAAYFDHPCGEDELPPVAEGQGVTLGGPPYCVGLEGRVPECPTIPAP